MANKNIKNINSKNKRGKIASKKKVITKPKFNKGKVQDARQTLLLKKRKGVTDARDILAKLAKTHDARSKLDKIRETRKGGVPRNGNIKIIGTNIVRKTDQNGKISLLTNKAKAATNIKLAIQRELGLVSPNRSGASRRFTQTNKRTVPNVSPQISSRKQPVLNAYQYESTYEPVPSVSSLYKWSNPAASQLINSVERPFRRNELLNTRTYENFSISRPLRTRAYIDLDAIDDEEMPLEVPLRTSIHLQGTSRSSNIHSRLDATTPQLESHGIFSQTKTKVVVPAGHRIVVSNLQNTVSQEDIKELFEDIGDLLAARLVRPGVAEVIYKNLKDAQKAVDTYHNRQLDGQPMKCLLVNKRPLNNPTAPALPKGEIYY
ncbi:hypothetical protein WA026_007138 [Henosepilachna vigintioctopunctata]|uniref:RRM domain-containing protein n=1 Tax=Henosepilachna vigintioctopunctata TaxID=420089 RepID=A0AAW1VBN3_9CUCU